jgi:hypothetical protein
MRYIDSMSKLRNEVPIPIDGPHASSAGASRAFRQHWSSGGNEDSGYRIIRPVMINEKQLKKPSTPGSSGSGSSRKPIVVVKTGSGTGTIREPVVEEISPTDPSDRREQHEKQQQPKTSPKHSITVQQSGLRSPAAEQRPSDFIIFQQHKKEEPQTSAGDKPIPGRVITRENLMITPDGIDIKPLPAVEKNTTSNGGHQNQQQKPKVPPKPSTKLAQHATDQPSAAVVAPSEEVSE